MGASNFPIVLCRYTPNWSKLFVERVPLNKLTEVEPNRCPSYRGTLYKQRSFVKKFPLFQVSIIGACVLCIAVRSAVVHTRWWFCEIWPSPSFCLLPFHPCHMLYLLLSSTSPLSLFFLPLLILSRLTPSYPCSFFPSLLLHPTPHSLSPSLLLSLSPLPHRRSVIIPSWWWMEWVQLTSIREFSVTAGSWLPALVSLPNPNSGRKSFLTGRNRCAEG